jgi:two-component system, OmpR family, response regulator
MTETAPSTSGPHILIVEDDAEISALIARYLHTHDMRTSIAADSQQMDIKLGHEPVDLITLDLNLPKEDGLSICLRLRKSTSVPIIMLTARSEDVDRILGLEMGADDYIIKPFNPRELLARIRAVLRRQTTGRDTKSRRLLRFAGWQLNRDLRLVLNPHGAKITLTAAEFDLLAALCDNPGRVLSRDHLREITQIRTSAPAPGSSERSIDILVSRLRQKIEVNPRDPEIIKTVRSGGYLFTQVIEAE